MMGAPRGTSQGGAIPALSEARVCAVRVTSSGTYSSLLVCIEEGEGKGIGWGECKGRGGRRGGRGEEGGRGGKGRVGGEWGVVRGRVARGRRQGRGGGCGGGWGEGGPGCGRGDRG